MSTLTRVPHRAKAQRNQAAGLDRLRGFVDQHHFELDPGLGHRILENPTAAPAQSREHHLGKLIKIEEKDVSARKKRSKGQIREESYTYFCVSISLLYRMHSIHSSAHPAYTVALRSTFALTTLRSASTPLFACARDACAVLK